MTRIIRLTPTRVEYVGIVNTAHGPLHRYIIETVEGINGQYWPRDRANAERYFQVGRAYKYRVVEEVNHDGSILLKIAPAKKDEPLTEGASVPSLPTPPPPQSLPRPLAQAPAPSLATPPSPQPIARPVAQVSTPTAQTTPIPPTKAAVDPQIAAMALSASVDLVKAGKLEVGQIEASVKKMVAMLMEL